MLSALNVMLVVEWLSLGSAAEAQLFMPSELYVMWYATVAPAGATQVAVTVPSARVSSRFVTLPGACCAYASFPATTKRDTAKTAAVAKNVAAAAVSLKIGGGGGGASSGQSSAVQSSR